MAAAVIGATIALLDPALAMAETITAALSQAYMGSPSLNAETGAPARYR